LDWPSAGRQPPQVRGAVSADGVAEALADERLGVQAARRVGEQIEAPALVDVAEPAAAHLGHRDLCAAARARAG
jgi:hypothetical protein